MQSTLMQVEKFIEEVCQKENETASSYHSKLMRLVHWMDAHHYQLRKLQPCDIEQFIHSLYKQKEKKVGSRIVPGHLSPFTIHTCLRTVKHFLKWAYTKGITHLDLSQFKIARLPPLDPKAVSAKTVLSLLEAASRLGEPWERARNLAMLYVLRDTAGRISAILKSDINNLDLINGKISVIEKGQKHHTLYLSPPTILAIIEWLNYRPLLEPQEQYLFLSYRGRHLTRSGFYGVMRRIVEAGGLKSEGRHNPHAFRHAWARDALNAGEDLSKVSQTLGHKTVRVTAEYYARWADKELQDAHSKYSPGEST